MKIYLLILGISDKEEENDDDTISIPDASILRRQIQDLCQEGEDKGCSEGANEPILESISQQFLVKEEVGSPLKNSKLAGIINNLFIEKLDEEKLKKLVKTYIYNKPENCPNMITLKCDEEIWRGDILNTSRRSNAKNSGSAKNSDAYCQGSLCYDRCM